MNGKRIDVVSKKVEVIGDVKVKKIEMIDEKVEVMGEMIEGRPWR